VVFSIVPDLLRFSSDLRLMLYGVVLVAAMMLFPTGFGGLLQRRSLARWRTPQ
jgi:branched-chain amino acid transport system permease protein